MNCLLLSIARSAYSAVWNDTCMKQMLIRYPYLQAQITAMDESAYRNTALGGYGSTVALLSSRIESA